MKKEYISPEIEVTKFDCGDILTNSGDSSEDIVTDSIATGPGTGPTETPIY